MGRTSATTLLDLDVHVVAQLSNDKEGVKVSISGKPI
jgi:hypothetical protein